MTTSEKKKLLTTNAYLWVAAIAVPLILHFGLSSTKFPWPMLVPLLLIWPAMFSNQLLSKAIGEPTDGPGSPTNE